MKERKREKKKERKQNHCPPVAKGRTRYVHFTFNELWVFSFSHLALKVKVLLDVRPSRYYSWDHCYSFIVMLFCGDRTRDSP